VSDAIAAIENADAIIERIAEFLEIQALGEGRELEHRGCPPRLAKRFAITALQRAVIKAEARVWAHEREAGHAD
jgi:hypothetical protein